MKKIQFHFLFSFFFSCQQYLFSCDSAGSNLTASGNRNTESRAKLPLYSASGIIGKLNDTYLGKLKFDGNSLLLAMEY